MPGFDGKGPLGRGSMSGGGRGYCMVDVGDMQGAGTGLRFGRRGQGNFCCGTREMGGRGRGLGKGFGRGQCHGGSKNFSGAAPAATLGTEGETLKEQAQMLKAQLDEIQRRLTELESKHEEK